MEIKDRIIQGSLKQFMQYGFRNVSMDDIARNLGMSKKTLYQYFEDKDELVKAALEYDIEIDQKDCLICSTTSSNAIAEVYNIINVVAEQLSDMNPMVLLEMQKFHPTAFSRFQQHKDGFILKMITENLKRGIAEELYREDINVEVLAKFRLESIMLIFNPEIFPLSKNYPLKELMLIIGEHFLYGIATSKGYKQIQKHQQERIKNK
ncbi:MAG: TetR/AcrR family transcriptional regulator [Ferruginibacter sp.]|nr:TetR/AcrR family transcriptional regulator [Ferruginibacter sp.]